MMHILGGRVRGSHSSSNTCYLLLDFFFLLVFFFRFFFFSEIHGTFSCFSCCVGVSVQGRGRSVLAGAARESAAAARAAVREGQAESGGEGDR